MKSDKMAYRGRPGPQMQQGPRHEMAELERAVLPTPEPQPGGEFVQGMDHIEEFFASLTPEELDWALNRAETLRMERDRTQPETETEEGYGAAQKSVNKDTEAEEGMGY